MPDVLFNLLLIFSVVVFLGVFLRAWRVTRAKGRSAGVKPKGGTVVDGDGGREIRE